MYISVHVLLHCNGELLFFVGLISRLSLEWKCDHSLFLWRLKKCLWTQARCKIYSLYELCWSKCKTKFMKFLFALNAWWLVSVEKPVSKRKTGGLTLFLKANIFKWNQHPQGTVQLYGAVICGYSWIESWGKMLSLLSYNLFVIVNVQLLL